jgi:two-component system phosphate regulon response regulator PhoB
MTSMTTVREQGAATKRMETSKLASILIVEDDPDIAEIISFNLAREGYRVTTRADGREGLQHALSDPPDLIVLDLMLPGLSGIDVCRQLRTEAATKGSTILMLTAKSEEVDQIVGFSVGADDYVTKPFSVKVLLQRIKALLARRNARAEEADRIEAHGIAVDRLAHEALLGNDRLPLTPTEYRILETLMSRPGKAYSRSDLLASAIGEDVVVLDRTIDVHIRSLRAKLGDMAWTIETVRSVGYRFRKDAPQ